jgi:glyoxylase-like metal-dependent hydrolase (beta-lactamase superfamily II)
MVFRFPVSRRLLFRKHYECVGGPLNMKGTGRSISHELLLTETFASEPMRVHCIQGYISSLFLVQYPERREWLLLDTGMPSDVERVQSFIENEETKAAATSPPPSVDETSAATSTSKDATSKKTSASRRSPNLVVSTHCHVDHLGAGHRWAKRGVPVAAASGYEAYYRGFWGRMQEFVDTFLSLLVAHRLGRRYESPFSSMRYKNITATPNCGTATMIPAARLKLDDGAVLPIFDDWVALKCPGHTDHMVIMYHPHTQILYVADFFVAPRRNRFQAPVPIDVEFAYAHSIHRLRKLPVRFALLAHGGVIDVEEHAGGWEDILTCVVERQKSKSRKAAFRLIDALTGFSSSPKIYTRDHLPRNPLPQVVESPPSITHIKNC